MNSLFEFSISISLIEYDDKIFNYFFWNNFNLILTFKFKYRDKIYFDGKE